MAKKPSREMSDWGSLLTFCVLKLGLKPVDFWHLTYAEFWPMYNAILGKTIQPLSMDEFENLQDQWAKGA